MLINLSPRFYLRYSYIDVRLIDVTIPELSLELKADEDITTRRPFPNKCYEVICRKKGTKAIQGFYVNTDKFISNFTLITRWAINGEISVHRVHFHVMDTDFDAVTDCILMWNDFHNTPYRSRGHTESKGWIPATDQPRMVTMICDIKEERREIDSIYNCTGGGNIIRERVEYYAVPTVERDRLAAPIWFNERFPALEDAFAAKVTEEYPFTLKPTHSAHLGIKPRKLVDWIQELNVELGECTHFSANVSLFKILREINESEDYFYTNTTDLVIKAKRVSATYVHLSELEKCSIDAMLLQAIFNVPYLEKI
ncbi:DUF6012 family protein [Yersinia enterocolitica]|uniref:DUF6012 family protein n=1 Tax=Yersinia TaxID=629 RepID=UPI0005E2686D|nr:DUF6012 family protein [Yersinia pseudotuberculosis]CND62630.1 Uncharacterised protein [Yersinia pseudotuberculosis]